MIPYTQAADQRQQRIIEQQYQNVACIVLSDSRQLMKVGVGFDTQTHNIDTWVVG